MTEIMCNPWLTYTSFPKFIDFKIHKIQSHSTKIIKKTIVQHLLKEILKSQKTSEARITTEELIGLIVTNENHQFVVTYNLMLSEWIKKNRKVEKEKLLANGDTRPFCFLFVKNMTRSIKKETVFKQSFNKYVFDFPKLKNEKNCHLGLVFCTNLKKLVLKFLKAANALNIRIEILKASSFKFQCFLSSLNEFEEPLSFSVQIYDNSDEYVLDFINKNLDSVRFMVNCFNLFTKMKK